MTIKPLADRVLVLPAPAEEKSLGISCTNVVLEDPVAPMMPTVSPD